MDRSEAGDSDGRVARGERNRASIVEAVIELLRAGVLLPTADQIAERAGVGARTVFRHFDDLEQLFAEVTGTVQERTRHLFSDVLTEGSLDRRARDLVMRRAQAYEEIAPFRRSVALLAHRSAFLREHDRDLVRRLRAQLIFALPELRDARAELLQGVELLSSFEAWDRLRRVQGLDLTATQRTLADGVSALLASR